MNYIYDIVLNFQDNYYNFFEWKNGDVIRNIPKISLYRVSDIMTLKYLYYEYFEEEEDNIEKIKELLLKELSKDWNIKQNNIYNIISMIGSVK